MSVIKVRQERRLHSEKLFEFNQKLKSHSFAFELKEPSFKSLHDAVFEDGEFYRLAVGLGPSYVERYYTLMQEKIRAQSEQEKITILQHVQREIFHHSEIEPSEFNQFCQAVNTLDTQYHLSSNAVHYLKQKQKDEELQKTISEKGFPYKLYHAIRTKL